jgi:hypothetical protein
MSWSSYAKNKVINVTTIYDLSYPITSSSFLTSALTTLETEDSLSFPQAKIVSEKNRFFELSIVFNENLQQVISLFTRSDDKKSNVANNRILSNSNNQSTAKACKENS